DYAARLLAHRGIIFLLSDFAMRGERDERARWEKTLRLVSRRHDVVGVSISDPAELDLPDIGIVTLEDPETGELTDIDTGRGDVHELFATLLERERAGTRRLFRRLGVDEIEVRTDEPY